MRGQSPPRAARPTPAGVRGQQRPCTSARQSPSASHPQRLTQSESSSPTRAAAWAPAPAPRLLSNSKAGALRGRRHGLSPLHPSEGLRPFEPRSHALLATTSAAHAHASPTTPSSRLLSWRVLCWTPPTISVSVWHDRTRLPGPCPHFVGGLGGAKLHPAGVRGQRPPQELPGVRGRSPPQTASGGAGAAPDLSGGASTAPETPSSTFLPLAQRSYSGIVV